MGVVDDGLKFCAVREKVVIACIVLSVWNMLRRNQSLSIKKNPVRRHS